MRICMLSTTFPRFRGDMYANFIYLLSKKLVERGVAVKVVCSHYQGVKREEKKDGIEISRYRYMIPETFQRLTYEGGILATLGKSQWHKILVPLFMCSFLLKGLKVGGSCDLIHAHWTVSGLIALLVGKWHKKPTVLTVHGSDINVLNKKFLLKFLNKLVLSRIDYIVVVSPVLKEKIEEMGVSREKVWYIPNGVDVDEFSPPPSSPPAPHRLLWVGRMSTEKGLHILIEAMREVLRTFPHAQLTLVGDGPERSTIKQLIKEYQLEQYVHLEGLCSHQEVSRYFRCAHVFVLPSLREGFPLVVLEALASGVPCIASNVGGLKAVVEDGVNGYLVSPSNIKELSLKVIELLNNPDVLKEMGKSARNTIADHYSWGSIADRTMDIYQQAMVGRNGKPQ